jgi:hypothetical protein
VFAWALSTTTPPPPGDPGRVFTIAPESGQFIVNQDYFANLSQSLNFESPVRSYSLLLTAARYGFDSGWSPMRSQSVSPGNGNSCPPTPWVVTPLWNWSVDCAGYLYSYVHLGWCVCLGTLIPGCYREIGVPPAYTSVDPALVDFRVQAMASDSFNRVSWLGGAG